MTATPAPTTTAHILSVLVQNKPGVLARIAGLTPGGATTSSHSPSGRPSRRSCRASPSRWNVSDLVLEQVTKQLNKLIEVLKIVELDPSGDPP